MNASRRLFTGRFDKPNGCRVSTGVARHVLEDEGKAVRRLGAPTALLSSHRQALNRRSWPQLLLQVPRPGQKFASIYFENEPVRSPSLERHNHACSQHTAAS